MAVPRLDDWLPNPAVRTHHRRSSLVDADELWRAALGLQLSDTVALGRLIRWRIPTPAGQPFGELFRSYPFTVLEEDRRLLVAGLCGRIWTLTRDYPALAGADAFRTGASRGRCGCCSPTGSRRPVRVRSSSSRRRVWERSTAVPR